MILDFSTISLVPSLLSDSQMGETARAEPSVVHLLEFFY